MPPELHELLKAKALQYNTPDFIPDDPVSIPHRFRPREDIEIAGLFAATIAWGRRDLILRSAGQLMARMENSPADFVRNASAQEMKALNGFVHRTFNAEDAKAFVLALRRIYSEKGGMEAVFASGISPEDVDVGRGLVAWRDAMREALPPGHHALKHVPDIEGGSAAKRLNMFLRWMVRQDKRGVDFGLWTHLKPTQLVLPLDVHTGRIARRLGLLERKQNDWRAVQEVTARLRQILPEDPAALDFALFGMGIYEGMP